MMTNVMVKTCLSQKIIKNWNLIQAMNNSVYFKAKVIGKPNFFESRICPNISPNIYRMFRSVDWRCGLKTRHDNRELRWSNTYSIFPKAEFVRIFIECSDFRSVDWTHDMIIVKWHLFIWQVRKLCALTNAPPVQSTQTGQWLSTFFHANCSVAHVYVLYPRQFIFALSCRRRSFLQVLQSTER